MASRTQRACFATLAVSSALGLVACGSSNNSGGRPAVVKADNGEAAKTGPQVMKDAAAAMTAAGAVHVVAAGTQGTPPQKLTMDGHVQSDGLSLTLKFAASEMNFIAIGKTEYLKTSGSDGFGSTFPAPLAKQYTNRWVKLSNYSSSGDSGTFSFSFSNTGDGATLASLGKSLTEPDKGVTINSKVAKGTLNGQPVVLVTESDGSTFTVAAQGPPYLLKAVKTATKGHEAEGSGALTFSDYGKRVAIEAPADAVDLGTFLKPNPGDLTPSTLPSDFPTDLPSS